MLTNQTYTELIAWRSSWHGDRYWTRSVTQTIFCPKFYECWRENTPSSLQDGVIAPLARKKKFGRFRSAKTHRSVPSGLVCILWSWIRRETWVAISNFKMMSEGPISKLTHLARRVKFNPCFYDFKIFIENITLYNN
jgi:hypothetical protein